MKKILLAVVSAILMVTMLTACANNKVDYTKVDDQLSALTEVKSGTSDIAVIDSVMANYYVNKSNFSDLQILTAEEFSFEGEYYAIGFRKNGDTASFVNYALYTIQQNGKLNTIAAKYGLTDALATIPETAKPADPASTTDFGQIKAKGELILGYTLFEPIAFEVENELTGFDIEVAKEVCSVLGITLKNVKINWNTKEDELINKTIDCIWNGFTYTEERAENISFSNYYLKNRQAIVIRKADSEKYKTYLDMKEGRFTAESESAGENTILTTITNKIFA